MSMKAKLGQPPSKNQPFVPGSPAKQPVKPTDQGPAAPTK